MKMILHFFGQEAECRSSPKFNSWKVPKTFFWLRLRPWGERNNKDAVYFQIKLKSPALLLFCWDLEGGFYVKEKTQTVKFIRQNKRQHSTENTSVLYRNVTYTFTIHSLRSVFIKLDWLNIAIPKFHFERNNLHQRLILHSYFWVFTAFEITKKCTCMILGNIRHKVLRYLAKRLIILK